MRRGRSVSRCASFFTQHVHDLIWDGALPTCSHSDSHDTRLRRGVKSGGWEEGVVDNETEHTQLRPLENNAKFCNSETLHKETTSSYVAFVGEYIYGVPVKEALPLTWSIDRVSGQCTLGHFKMTFAGGRPKKKLLSLTVAAAESQ